MSVAVQSCPPSPSAAGLAIPDHVPAIDIAVRASAGRTWIAVRGELDILTAPELRSQLRTCTDHQCGDVVVDLGALDFVDARGLSVLVEGHRRLRECRRRLSITSPSACVRRLLDLTGLGTLFSVDTVSAVART